MNIRWKHNKEERWYLASDETGKWLFSICARNCKAPDAHRGGAAPPHTRWCVFADDKIEGYSGDLPITLAEDDLKAAAIALWRIGPEKMDAETD